METTERPPALPRVPPDFPRGVKLIHDPVRNKGTAFTAAERDLLGLRGLLPPRVQSQDVQVQRVMENLRQKPTDLERYIFLVSLQDRNEMLFYRVALDHLDEIMPIIYTPTVGEACQAYGHIFRRPRGLYVTAEDRGQIDRVLLNWPHQDVRMIVVTDGERILGLGDLGAAGMGIPVGKLALYSVCAGIHPTSCLPVTLDVGTNNEALLRDPLYIGLQQRRLQGQAYDDLVDEFVTAVRRRFPGAVIQLEDFGNKNAFRLLERYRASAPVFNDDIQGTGAVALAGLLSSLRITKRRMRDGRYLFLGAGEAGIGIADLIVRALVEEGVPADEARRHCWFLDSKGLVVKRRDDLASHKRAYAHDHPFTADLHEAVRALKPSALIGVSGVPQTFTQPVLEELARHVERPVVFALSNPTSKAECTARQAYAWTDGRAVFASGSPFDPVDLGGRTFVPGQGNNAYIFPGVGLGAIASQARSIPDEMFFAAAKALAGLVTDSDLSLGRLYPALSRVREVSAAIATAVATMAFDERIARGPRPEDVAGHVAELMFDPVYASYA